MAALDGKVALISGAAHGQGAAEARLFVAEGARVVIADVDDVTGIETARDLGDAAAFVHLDVASEVDWEKTVGYAISEFGALDILVNNAGVYRPKSLEQTSLSDYEEVIRINQLGVFLGMRIGSRPMVDAGRGSIINVSSGAGARAVSGAFAYSTSKWAVRGMGASGAAELSPRGVRVNTIFPGPIDTEMLDSNTPERYQAILKAVPIGRMGTVDEVAQLVLFLASDASSYVTGAEIRIDGGRHV